MERFIEKMLHGRIAIIAVFVIATVLCMILSQFVGVNYNLMDYLPDESPSTVALNIMDEEYTTGAPNARVMLRDVTIPEALEYKAKIEKIDGVDEITWLDDSENIYEPIEFMDQDTVADYYADNNALFTVTLDEDKETAALDAIKEVAGDKGAYSGTAVESVAAQQLTTKEIQKIMVIVVLIILAVLMLTTTSWFEPVLFLTAIGVAIMLNRGTNIIFGEISFVTNAAGAILQLAVSMDYSIFLVHRFNDCRQRYPDDVTHAMAVAIKESTGSVLSSGLTTVLGFAALILMRFKIGPDMGLVMAKSIVLSLVSVLVFLPCITLCTYKWIDKTQHKLIIPPFKWLVRIVMKVRVPVLILFVVITVPCIFAQNSNAFTYGSSGIYGKGTSVGDDIEEIESIFGQSNLMVLMVPKDSLSQEKAIAEELKAKKEITSVITYSETVGVAIPQEFVPKDQISDLISKNYSRYVITVDTPAESKRAFRVVEDVRAIAEEYYPGKYQLLGTTVNSYDLKDVVTADNVKVNLVSLLAIFAVLLINFRSLSIPVILLAVIESSIWINLSFPYFMDTNLFYIGYLIISSIQLGATVDYAILFADNFIEHRREMPCRVALKKTIEGTSLSILTSGSILTVAGLLLGAMSSNGVISQLGTLVGRGAILSVVLVIFVLPALIAMLDPIIEKTTYHADFFKRNIKKRGKSNETEQEKISC